MNGEIEIANGLNAGEQVAIKGGFVLKSLLLKSSLQEDNCSLMFAAWLIFHSTIAGSFSFFCSSSSASQRMWRSRSRLTHFRT